MQTQQTPGFWQRNGIFLKSLLIGFLIMALMIPAILIQDLVRERQSRQEEVIQEVSSKWASAQTISGPFLVVPYTAIEKDDKGKAILVKHFIHYLPETLEADGELFPEIRHRSIFEIVLYRSSFHFKGKFAPLKLALLGIDPSTVQWSEARLCFGLTDNRGIAEALQFNWNGKPLEMEPGIPTTDIATAGVNAPLPETGSLISSDNHFDVQLKLNGSERLFFTPLGKTTKVHLKSNWTNPAFTGNFLPAQPAVINEKGFTAEWNILHFTRDIPQLWNQGKPNIEANAFGVQLLQGVDGYAKTMRAVKYALLFIALTFCLYFFIELLKKKLIHPLQYVLVGLALCIFYTLLLSFSEYIQFNWAYLIASTATIGLITSYTQSVFRNWGITAAFLVFLSALYGFIYILIQLQDGALLFGSIGLFILLAVVMFYSKKIDWYGARSNPSAEPVTEN